MTYEEAGGAAFPSEDMRGMTLRAWFAGQALAGILADPDEGPDPGQKRVVWAEGIAKACFILADAMLAEAKKGKA